MCRDSKSGNSTDDDSDISSKKPNPEYRPLEHKAIKKNATRRIVAQTLVTGAVMLSSASCGMPVGYSAILLPQLKSTNGTMQVDDEIGSWIASVHSAATPLGSLLCGILMDRCGRKTTLQIAALPLILGWGLICAAQNHVVLLAGRLFAGMSAGLAAAAGQVLIGESTEPHYRGMFSSAPFASYSFGILLVYALGSLLHWRIVAGLSTTLPLLSIVIFFFLPESPVWLIRNGKYEKARKALVWLRGGNLTQAIEEAQHLVDRIDKENAAQTKTTAKMFLQPDVLKPLIIINVFNILQVLSGTYLIVFYAVDIVSHLQEGSIDHFLAAVLTACVRFIFTIFASILLGLIGRRTLSMVSGLGTTIAAFCLALFLQQNCSGSAAIPALLVLIYVAMNTVGFLILTGVMMSELFPAKIRGQAGGITFMIFNFTLFGVAKMFPFVKNSIGIHGVFWIFGTAGLLASLFLYLTLPETKGQSLSDIEDYFRQKNFLWVKRDKNWIKKLQNGETERLNNV